MSSELKLRAGSLASLSPVQREKFLRSLKAEELAHILSDWHFWRREKQIPPEAPGKIWLPLAGRGWGKTWVGGNTFTENVRRGIWKRPAIIGPTASDVRKIMITGEQGNSGILKTAPPSFRPQYFPANRQLIYPNGVIASLYTAEEPERLRGPEHDGFWADELRAWPYPEEAWDNLSFGLRALAAGGLLGVITTTSKPFPLLRKLLKDPTVIVTRGSTYENEANLDPGFIQRIKEAYEGTRLGRQELHAEMLEDVEGALWALESIEKGRSSSAPELTRIVVALDPSVTSGKASAECGIVAAGRGKDGHFYVLADASLRASAQIWASQAAKLFHQLKADRIIGEVNNGGDLIEKMIKLVDETVPFKAVRATRGKAIRAEPVAALYEQGKVHHVGAFPILEEQMTSWVPDGEMPSPDRLDALVWALTELSAGDGVRLRII